MVRNTALSDLSCPPIKLFAVLSILFTIVFLFFLRIFRKVLHFAVFLLGSLDLLKVIYSIPFGEDVAFHLRLFLL